MKSKLITTAMLLALSTLTFAQQKSNIHLLKTHKIHSDGGWDYLTVDEKNNNLFVSHGTQVNIISTSTGDSVGVINNTLGVHGIAIVNQLNKGYTTNGKAGNCTVFDLKTFKVLGQVAVGQNPDATFYDDYSQKVIVFNGKSKDASIIDPKTDKLIATIPLGGKPEAGVSDGKGRIYVNIEDTGEIVCFDIQSNKVLSRYKLKGGEEPSGLAIDREKGYLFTVCSNKVMLVIEAKSGKQIANLPIGDECDGVLFDPATKLVYASNGEGNITVVKPVASNKFAVQETIKTEAGARTIAIDLKSHHLFLPTAEFDKTDLTSKRPKKVPGTFHVLEFGK